MHWLIKAMLLSICFDFATFADTKTETAREADTTKSSAKSTFIVGISPFLDKEVKDDVFRTVVRLMVEQLPLNSTLSIYDAFELKTIAQITVPEARAFSSPKTRANQFAPAIHELKNFLAQEHSKPVAVHLDFTSCIRVPQFLDFLAENKSFNDARVLLIGSPLYQDAREPSFSMVEGFFPSDGHLQATREQSIYGFDGNKTDAPSLKIDWLYLNDPWISELHHAKVERFWSLYMDRRGSTLNSFTSDRPSAVQGFLSANDFTTSTKNFAVDRSDSKIEMHRVSRSVASTDWLTADHVAASPPPSTRVGVMKIGIRWKDKIDLDLYATPRPEAETLFFQHVRSPEGYYNKDHRSSPGKEYEFIEFEKPIDIREVEAYVNFYKGECPGGPSGEVRIEFDGHVYGAPFHIEAEEGNKSRTGKSQRDYWTRIPIQEVMGIHTGLGAAN